MDDESKKIQTMNAPCVPASPSPETPTAEELKALAEQQEVREREKYLLGAGDVAALLNVKPCMAYKIIRECNAELKAAGKLVIRGKVLKKYLLKKIEV